jgi:hypothetical protein
MMRILADMVSDTGNPYADTRGMYMIHNMFRREFALMPALIEAVPPEDGPRIQVVADHIAFMCGMLYHHHSAEDEYVWPLLLARAPKEIDPVVLLVEDHHRHIDELLTEAAKRLAAWRDGASKADGAPLDLTLRRLAVAAFEHMGVEERLVLPVVERYMFASEWDAMGRHTLESLTQEEVLLAIGMTMYEVDQESAPGVFPEQVLTVAPRAYAAYAERVHGTATPPHSTELSIGTPPVGLTSEVAEG